MVALRAEVDFGVQAGLVPVQAGSAAVQLQRFPQEGDLGDYERVS